MNIYIYECGLCYGTGKVTNEDNGKELCGHCNGSGVIEVGNDDDESY